jgi:sn-glycerol 3-phosphate transport system permease protein
VLEAAQIDGANRVQRFWRVTFPLLAPFSFFLLVTNVTYSFYGIYGAIDTLTRGGPPIGAAGELGGATNVLIYKLYRDAFTPGSPAGLAAAQAVILFLLVAGLTVLQFRTIESRITYGE